MANSLLTATAVTREALRVLHQKLSFIGNVNREYDDSYSQTGAKIGDSLKIRLPNRYTVRSNATFNPSDIVESSTTLQIATQKGVDMNFTSVDLTLSLDDFSSRIIDPAMSVLTASIESDALSMYKDVANLIDDDAAAISFLTAMKGRQRLNEELAPPDMSRSAILCPTHNTKMVDALKGLFNDTSTISQQYKEGKLGRTAGLTWYENTLLTAHQTGTAAKVSTYLSNGATQSGASIAVDTGVTTFKKGDVITFAGVNAVHAESKADLLYLKQFTFTADYAGGAGNIAISPALVATGAAQNVSSTIADNSAIVKVGAGASETLIQSLLFHRDAFTFATADLVDVSKYGAWGARQQLDGISMRIARQYDIVNDKIPTRLDVLYGYKTIRPELAVRLHADG